MIDIHSHILPSIDDGSQSIETTIEMLQMANKDGTKKIVATPHYYIGYYENKYEDVNKLVSKVNNIALEKGIDTIVLCGQEVFLDKHTLEYFKNGTIGCIEGTSYMLVELPMDTMPRDALDIIYELKIRGIKPIVAHPERYRYVIENPSKINDFVDEECLLQINTGSIKGLFGKKVQKTSEILIQHGLCNFIASDAHTTRSRCPGLNDALELLRKINVKLYNEILVNGEKLLSNDIVHMNGEKIKEKKSFFKFWNK